MRRAVLLAALALAACDDGTPVAALGTAPLARVPVCPAAPDGVIAPGELDFSAGPTAPYAVQKSSSPRVAPTGDAAAGEADWDFRQTSFGELAEIPLLDPAAFWYADRVPDATLSLPFGPADGGAGSADPADEPGHMLLRATEDVVFVLGVASIEPERQLLIYDAGAPFLRFPLAVGHHWEATVAPAEGSVWRGIALDQAGLTDTWRLEVTGAGHLELPGLRIDDVLQLSLTLERRLRDNAPWVARETYLLHECLGTVARRSEPDGDWWVVWYPPQ